MPTTPRYTFDRSVTDFGDGSYAVSAVTAKGWNISWFVEPDAQARTGWRIWRPTPSNETLAITPTGSLGRAILARVNDHRARKEIVS